MIVGSSFPGDVDEKLKWIQHDLYGELLGYLFSHPRERYLAAGRLIGKEADLAGRIKAIQTFDHRILQDAHDKIAAYYRFAHDGRGQMALFSDESAYVESLKAEWCEFYHQEVRRLANNTAICVAILTSVAYADTQVGRKCEADLARLLIEHFGSFLTGAR